MVRAGVFYFACVFGTGVFLGAIRTTWMVPRVGTRTAELMETPLMIVAMLLSARWIVRRLALPFLPSVRLGMGGAALVLMLLAEFSLVLWLRGLTLRQYLADRDPVAGSVYYAALVLFAVMPLLVERQQVARRQ